MKPNLQEMLIDSDSDIKALDELFERSSIYQTSSDYYKLLQFINKFPKISPFNAFLIHMQNPGVEVVLNSRNWSKKFNRTVKPFARPLVILVPFGPVDFVYDILDTEGSEIPNHLIQSFYTSGDFDDQIFHNTVNNLSKEKIEFEERTLVNNVGGYAKCIYESFFIHLNNIYGTKEKYTTLIHEIAHIVCGHLGGGKNCWWKDRTYLDKITMEVEAESIAYLVCKRIGLNSNSETYLSNYIKDNKEMPPISLDTILTLSGYIEQMGLKKFKSKNK